MEASSRLPSLPRRGGTSPVNGGTQLELKAILSEIHECLADACGETAAKTIENFVPTSLAVHDPDRYERALGEFVPTLSKRIVDAVRETVSRTTGVEFTEGESLFECMLRVNANKGGLSSTIGT
jgi:hypothetical protein